MELVALTGANRPRDPPKIASSKGSPVYAGDNQILIERGFEDAGIRGAETVLLG